MAIEVASLKIGTRSTDAGLLVALSGVLPQLGRGLTTDAAEALVRVLLRELAIDAAAVVGGDIVLAFRGAGADHHVAGRPYRTLLAGRALNEGRVVVARGARAVGCAVPGCPLTGGVASPVKVGGKVIGAIILLRDAQRPLSGSVRRGAQAVAQFLGKYLDNLDRPDIHDLLRHEVAKAARYAEPLAVSVFSATEVPAERIKALLGVEARAADIIAVLDGNSVALIKPKTALEPAQTAAARICDVLQRELGAQVTAGTAAYPAAPDPATLIRQAAPA